MIRTATDAIAQPVQINAAGAMLTGDLRIPVHALGVVVFVHGSGSSRFSRRNRAVAEVLGQAGVGTLLLDLLTSAEESIDATTAEFRFDIPLLADRTAAVVDWITAAPGTRGMPLGLFGASTGAAAALIASAARPRLVHAVVSRGGRPDLAEDALERVAAPTLLIVGSLDDPVLELNETVKQRLRVRAELAIVPGATHLFEETGALDHVARLAADWFVDNFTRATHPERYARG